MYIFVIILSALFIAPGGWAIGHAVNRASMRDSKSPFIFHLLWGVAFAGVAGSMVLLNKYFDPGSKLVALFSLLTGLFIGYFVRWGKPKVEAGHRAPSLSMARERPDYCRLKGRDRIVEVVGSEKRIRYQFSAEVLEVPFADSAKFILEKATVDDKKRWYQVSYRLYRLSLEYQDRRWPIDESTSDRAMAHRALRLADITGWQLEDRSGLDIGRPREER
jgi:hypothetical protein